MKVERPPAKSSAAPTRLNSRSTSPTRAAAADLEFEEAARLRDEIKRLESLELGLQPNMAGRSLQASTPAGPRKKDDWKPKPLGPGGGGYDPKKGKGGEGG